MDRGKNKRKMEGADQEENEDEKMEQFFALIKSTREVRERLVGAAENKEKAAGDKPPPAVATATAAWNPTFRPEDFMEAPPPSPSPPPPQETEKAAAEAGPSKEGEEKQESDEKSGDKGLDLNLSL